MPTPEPQYGERAYTRYGYTIEAWFTKQKSLFTYQVWLLIRERVANMMVRTEGVSSLVDGEAVIPYAIRGRGYTQMELSIEFTSYLTEKELIKMDEEIKQFIKNCGVPNVEVRRSPKSAPTPTCAAS